MKNIHKIYFISSPWFKKQHGAKAMRQRFTLTGQEEKRSVPGTLKAREGHEVADVGGHVGLACYHTVLVSYLSKM